MNKTDDIRREVHVPGTVRVREAAEGEEKSRTITGYAILFNTRSTDMSYYSDEEEYEIIAPEAVTRELLDGSDIKMTINHNRERLLARSDKGEGTLTYGVDEKGVYFEFEAPHTVDGDTALELVRRGDIKGCSFAFRTHYYDDNYVSSEATRENGKTVIVNTVRMMTGIYDFTLASDPAYPDTECAAERELRENLHKAREARVKNVAAQVKEMRQIASKTII